MLEKPEYFFGFVATPHNVRYPDLQILSMKIFPEVGRGVGVLRGVYFTGSIMSPSLTQARCAYSVNPPADLLP
jgi:hypothetical protein